MLRRDRPPEPSRHTGSRRRQPAVWGAASPDPNAVVFVVSQNRLRIHPAHAPRGRSAAMDDVPCIDWVGYLHELSDDDLHELAAWLAAEGLKVSEFTDILDRVYAHTSDRWRGRALAFVTDYGRPVAEAYARRKRRFTQLMAALEDAQMSGALPGTVAPQELQPRPPQQPQPPARTAEELFSVLVRVRSGSG